MPWAEFKQLLAGIAPETPLGRIVSIRAENNKDVLKHFTKGQRKIRNDWCSKHVKTMSIKNRDEFLKQMKQMFISMSGGKK